MIKNKIGTDVEFLRGLSEKIRKAAVSPDINGYIPHGKQVDFHNSDAQKRLFLGGNRSGKTVGGATEAVWWLTGTHPYVETPRPPVRGRCCTVDFLNGLEKIVKPEVARWLPPSQLLGGSWDSAYNRELRMLTLANGSFLEFMSYDQDVDKFAGTSRHFTWFDEEPPRDIYIECLQRLVDVGGSFWITMTPVDGMSSWVYDELYLAKAVDDSIHVTEVTQTDNPHLNEGEVALILSGLTEEERKARREGKFIQIGGLIYDKYFSQENVIDPMDKYPDDWLHVAALDHGFSNPTAWLWACIDSDGRIIVYDEYYLSGEIVRYHAARVHEINESHGRLPDYYVGDPSIRNTDPITGTSVLLEYLDFGLPIVLGNNDVRAGINRVARYFEGSGGIPKLYITKNCTNLLREIPRYRWGQWAQRKLRTDRNKKEEPHKKDDHAVDALRYLVASRPEMDTGSEVPEIKHSHGAPEAATSVHRYDTELRSTVSSSNYESFDGVEYDW